MNKGTIAEGMKSRRFIAYLLIVAIGVCAVLIGLGDLGRGWTITLQIGSAVAGAALGNFLRLDAADHVVANQARPAIRHLFDQIGRLRALVVRAERFQTRLADQGKAQVAAPDCARVADWFGALGSNLRDEINATALAIENWGDLAQDVRDDELANFKQRADRLPPDQNGAAAHD